MAYNNLFSRYDELPPLHKRVYNLALSENLKIAQFAEKIGVSQQVLSRQFNKGKNGAYNRISPLVRDAIKSTYGFDDTWFYVNVDGLEPTDAPSGESEGAKLVRFKMAVDVILNSGRAMEQQEIAAALCMNKVSFSFVMNGHVAVTDELIHRFCLVYDNIINAEWIMTGEGDMINAENSIVNNDGQIIKQYKTRIAELEVMLNDAAAEIIKLNKELRELRANGN